ncbi:MAG: DNA polymerase I, partial [Pedosphaera parvula]|nr:DNA polymerase I [Pedosphaera parvula]
KAQRQEMPEDLALAIPQVRRLLDALRVPLITCPGYEADDIIGTLARRAGQQGFRVYMVTPDKDFAQLVSDRVFHYKPGRGNDPPEILGYSEVLEQWGVKSTEQVIDILGLWGDASDNIPGIPGVGENTAQKLIAQYGSLENLLAHAADLKGKLRQNVETHAHQARLSRKLATILCDAPVPVGLDDLQRRPPDEEQLRPLFREFEFLSLGKRLFGDSFSAPPGLFQSPPAGVESAHGGTAPDAEASTEVEAPSGEEAAPDVPPAAPQAGLKTISDVPHDYRVADTPDARAQMLSLLERQPSFCLDLETTGLDTKNASLVGLAVSFEAHTGWYLPFPADRRAALTMLEEFRPLLEDPAKEKIGHNLKYDLSVLRWHGIRVQGKLFDTMIAHCLVAPEMRHGMDYLSQVYLGYSPIPISALIGSRAEEQRNMSDVPVEKVAEYSAEDADVTWQLRPVMENLLREKNAERVYHEVEAPLIPVLVEMEHEGIAIDAEALQEYSQQLSAEIEEFERRIHRSAGTTFNISSPKQLGEVLFDVLKLDPRAKKTRTGQYATDEHVLARLASRHEIVRLVLDYRECRKLKSTYVDTLPQAIFPPTGRVHTTYNQAVVVTGRMQSQNPNLQNVPVRGERGREVRKAFVPRSGDYALLSADYSQIELRIIAELSQDQGLLDAFSRGQDIHGATAARVYGVPLDQVTAEMRRKAKMVNFGIIYGISAFGLSQRLGISRTEAGDIIDQYFVQYPGVQSHIARTIDSARRTGYVQTLTGRRRYLRDIQSANASIRGAAERNAINSPIQGTAADMIKIAMARIHRHLMEEGFRSRMLLQVHDELVFDLYRPEKEALLPMVEREMKSALPMRVPIAVEMGIGKNWLDAHE